MTGYDIYLSDGDLLTTINVKTIDEQNNSSLVLIGQGIPDYGTSIAQNFVWLMENFSKSTPPVNPLAGQHWYDRIKERMNFYTGTEWRHYSYAESSFAQMFDMATAATNIDFTLTGTTAIFTGGDASKTYYPTHVMLVPTGAFNATSPATADISVSSAGDVLASATIPIIPSSKFIKMPTNAQSAFISGTGTLNLNITAAASGGQLNYNVYIFGTVL